MNKHRRNWYAFWIGYAAIAALAIFFTYDANASGKKPPMMMAPQPKLVNDQHQWQTNRQEQANKQTNTQNASASSDNFLSVDNSDTLRTDVNVAGDNTYFDQAASSAYAPQAWSTVSCDRVIGLGWQNRSGGGSVGIPMPGFIDKLFGNKMMDCSMANDASHLAQLGMKAAAVESLCGQSSMQKVHGGGAKHKADRIANCIGKLLPHVDRGVKITALEAENADLRQRIKYAADESAASLTELRRCRNRSDRIEQACQQGK